MPKKLTALYKLAAILIVIASVFYFSSGANAEFKRSEHAAVADFNS